MVPEEDAVKIQKKTKVRSLSPPSETSPAIDNKGLYRKPNGDVANLPKKVPEVVDMAHVELPRVNNDAMQLKGQKEEEVNEDEIPNLVGNHKKKPSRPLCDECLEIVQRAKPMDITFVDVSHGNTDFPHKGARDDQGNWGYLHDETALRRNPPPFNFDGDDLKEACVKRDNNFRMLSEQVFVDMKYDSDIESSGVKRDKIFCLVYTIEGGHPKIPNIRETWG